MCSNLILVHEFRFEETADGTLWASSAMNQWFTRFTSEFQKITVFARVTFVTQPSPSYERVRTFGQLTIQPLTYRKGILGLVAAQVAGMTKTLAQLRSTRNPRPIIIRFPTTSGIGIGLICLLMRSLLAAEVVGDAFDSVYYSRAPGPVKKPMARLYSALNSFLIKRADCALYVTESTLQKRYPSRAKLIYSASNVELGPEWFKHEKDIRIRAEVNQLLAVASLNHRYKGLHVLLESLTNLPEPIRLVIAGCGRLELELLTLAETLNLANRVEFYGRVTHGRLRCLMQDSDIFVSASLSEGMPRAVLEAMAQALPVVATDVGGCSEILSQRALVAPNSANAISSGVLSMMHYSVRKEEAVRNRIRAQDFRLQTVSTERARFAIKIKELSS